MFTGDYQPNRWKLTEGDDSDAVIDYFTAEEAAYEAFAKFDLDKRAVRLYSCFEDDDNGLTEWEIEEWNCDLDTGEYDSGNPATGGDNEDYYRAGIDYDPRC